MKTRAGLWERFAMWIGRRFWVHRIDVVLHEAKESGKLDNYLVHELDAKLKYGTDPRKWSPRDR